MRRIRTCAALLTLSALLAAPAAAQQRLAPPAVMRIPDAAGRPFLVLDANAPRVNGEFATAIRTPADRAALRAQIERDRAAQNARFAKNAGPGIAVTLRRPRYLVRATR